jgi:hypothetical protein
LIAFVRGIQETTLIDSRWYPWNNSRSILVPNGSIQITTHPQIKKMLPFGFTEKVEKRF